MGLISVIECVVSVMIGWIVKVGRVGLISVGDTVGVVVIGWRVNVGRVGLMMTSVGVVDVVDERGLKLGILRVWTGRVDTAVLIPAATINA